MLLSQRCKVSENDRVTDGQTAEYIVQTTEDVGQRQGSEEFVLRSIPRVVKQLCKQFPEHLNVD